MRIFDTFKRRGARMIPALFCLVAVCLMQAPLVLAAWSISTGLCCTGNSCPIAAHHHKKMAAEHAHEMDCGHDMSGMTGCKMDCCHDTEQATIAAGIFVMPPVASRAAKATIVATVEAPKYAEFLRTTEPTSPPPRTTATIL